MWVFIGHSCIAIILNFSYIHFCLGCKFVYTLEEPMFECLNELECLHLWQAGYSLTPFISPR